MSSGKYFGFAHKQAVEDAFDISEGAPSDDEILFASYGGGNWDGNARVIFERDGELYEVYGSHCSCFGLEGQWDPQPITWEALKLRTPGDYSFLGDHDEGALEAFRMLVASRAP